MPSTPLSEVIDVQQAAVILGLKIGRVSQLLRRGELPGRKLTSFWVLHEPSVRRIAKKRRKWARPAS